MARRMTKAESSFWALVIIIGVPIYLLSQLVKSIGWGPIGGIVGAGVLLWFCYEVVKKRERLAQVRRRREALLAKYGNEELVAKLMNRMFWQGQSAEQLADSLGRPEDVDEKVLKTKRKEVWKYDSLGSNRYGLRITLENGSVVGWDKK